MLLLLDLCQPRHADATGAGPLYCHAEPSGLHAGVIGEHAVAVDAFAGCGGNTVALAATCHHVVAVDCDEQNAGVVWHNAGVYGVADRVQVICGDFFAVAPHLQVLHDSC